jgi:hypothetical protein
MKTIVLSGSRAESPQVAIAESGIVGTACDLPASESRTLGKRPMRSRYRAIWSSSDPVIEASVNYGD